MFRCNANVRENKSLAGSRSPPGRHTAARGSAPREAGTEQHGAAAPLPPAGHCSPGKPRPHAGHLLFLKLGVFRGKYVPAGLGHLPLHRPSPRPWPSSCSGRALSARSRGSAAGPGGGVGWGAAGRGSHGGPAVSQLLARWAHGALALGTPSFVCNEGAPTPGRFAAVAPTTRPGCCSPSRPGAGLALGHGTGSACGHPVYPRSKCPFRQQPGMQSPCQRLCAALGVPGDGQRGRVEQGFGGRGTSWCQHPGGDRALGSQ